MVQAVGGGAMVWGIYYWHTLGPLVSIEHCLNAPAYLSIVAYRVHPFMTTVYQSSNGYFQQGKARQGKFICIAHFIHSGNSKCFT